MTTTEAIVRCGDQVKTHSEIRQRAARLAAVLAEHGVGHGDRYALLMRNEVRFVEATLAGAAIGAVPVPINWHWNKDELTDLIQDSASKLVIAHRSLIPVLRQALPDGVVIIEVDEPEVLRTAYGLADDGPAPDLAQYEQVISDHEPLVAEASADPPMGVLYTSGTTGNPKGILRHPLAPDAMALLGPLIVQVVGAEPGIRTMATAPLYHATPNQQIVFALAVGCDFEIMPRFDPEGFLRLVEKHQIETVQMVPIMFIRLLRLPAEVRAKYDLSSLRAVIHAAAPCPPEAKRGMIEWLGPIVKEFYGSSEVGACVLCSADEWLSHPGTVGRVLGDADVRILDEMGNPVPTGELGDIYIKPAPGWPEFTYIGNDQKRRDMERDGYLTVGDIGYLDDDGFLFLADRRNDMIISGGVNIYPAEIEASLLGMPGVADVAVFGVPDAEYGEAVAAHVEPIPGAQLSEDDVRDYVAARLAKYKVPTVVVFEEQLPRHDSGKLYKRKLKALYH